jgi:predicted house-cleaning noncanonical NTP pyrophosphatase (MazG superfamily)
MKILGLTIHGFHFRNRRQRKVTNKLDRIANAALLNAAVKNPEVLAQIINKYGEIQVYQDDEMETKIQNLRTKIYEEAAETLLNNRRQELVSHVGEIIDRVMGLNSVTGGGQREESPFKGATPRGQNSTSNIARRRHGIQRSLETSSNPSILIRGLAILAVLEGIIDQQRTKQSKGSMEE